MQSSPLSNQNSKQLQEAQENLREQVMIGFGFLIGWESGVSFFKLITERSNAKLK